MIKIDRDIDVLHRIQDAYGVEFSFAEEIYDEIERIKDIAEDKVKKEVFKDIELSSVEEMPWVHNRLVIPYDKFVELKKKHGVI